MSASNTNNGGVSFALNPGANLTPLQRLSKRIDAVVRTLDPHLKDMVQQDLSAIATTIANLSRTKDTISRFSEMPDDPGKEYFPISTRINFNINSILEVRDTDLFKAVQTNCATLVQQYKIR